MILSHKYKFIFLKTNKTAGTSIEIALSKFCGPDDIITPISKKDEKTRQALGYRGPQNYAAPPWQYSTADVYRFLRYREKKHRFYNHISGREVRARIGPEIWDHYYKFCVERNPWDRVVSLYYFVHRKEPRPDIREFLASPIVNILKERGIELYTIGGNIAVDRVCRYESLAEELETIRKHLGLPEPLELPRAKSEFRPAKVDYRQQLDQTTRNQIADIFRQEIEWFGYRY